ARVLDAHPHRETEPSALARANRHGASDLRARGVALLLLRDEVERAAEAGGVARGEQVLRRGGPRLARAAHLLRHREVGPDEAVARLRVAVAPADGGGLDREQGLDLVHGRVEGMRLAPSLATRSRFEGYRS